MDLNFREDEYDGGHHGDENCSWLVSIYSFEWACEPQNKEIMALKNKMVNNK